MAAYAAQSRVVTGTAFRSLMNVVREAVVLSVPGVRIPAVTYTVDSLTKIRAVVSTPTHGSALG